MWSTGAQQGPERHMGRTPFRVTEALPDRRSRLLNSVIAFPPRSRKKVLPTAISKPWQE